MSFTDTISRTSGLSVLGTQELDRDGGRTAGKALDRVVASSSNESVRMKTSTPYPSSQGVGTNGKGATKKDEGPTAEQGIKRPTKLKLMSVNTNGRYHYSRMSGRTKAWK